MCAERVRLIYEPGISVNATCYGSRGLEFESWQFLRSGANRVWVEAGRRALSLPLHTLNPAGFFAVAELIFNAMNQNSNFFRITRQTESS